LTAPTAPCPGCAREVATSAVTCPHCGRSMEDAGGRPPVAQAVPPQPVPVEPQVERAMLEQVGCGLILAAIAAALVFLAVATSWWRP
jgi:hypothetical protein